MADSCKVYQFLYSVPVEYISLPNPTWKERIPSREAVVAIQISKLRDRMEYKEDQIETNETRDLGDDVGWWSASSLSSRSKDCCASWGRKDLSGQLFHPSDLNKK